MVTAVYAGFGGAGAGVFLIGVLMLLSDFRAKLPQPPEPSLDGSQPATDPDAGDVLEATIDEVGQEEARHAEAVREAHERAAKRQAEMKKRAQNHPKPKSQ